MWSTVVAASDVQDASSPPSPLPCPGVNDSMSPWKALEGAVAKLMDTTTFYAFRLGEKLLFMGPYGPPTPPDPRAPSPLDGSHTRRSSAPASVGSASPGSRGLMSESPVSRARAAAADAAKAILSKGQRIGWNSRSGKEEEEMRWNDCEGEFGDGGGRGSGSGSTIACGSVSSGAGSRRGDSGVEGSRLERAVSEALIQ